MHYCALVVLPPDGDLNELLTDALAPWREQDGGIGSPDGWWDWWQVGGRYTGKLSDGYEPERDPANWEVCIHCGGTGTRAASGLRDGRPWCNGCTHDREYGCPLGVSVRWPSHWVAHHGDVVRPAAVLARPEDERLCWTILAGEVVKHREWFVDDPTAKYGYRCETNAQFDSDARRILRSVDPESRVVVVDYHS